MCSLFWLLCFCRVITKQSSSFRCAPLDRLRRPLIATLCRGDLIIKSVIKGTILILLSPAKFSVYATDLNVQEQLKSKPHLSKESPEGQEFIREMEGYNLARANKIRASFLHSLFTTFSSIIFGVIFGYFLKNIFGSPSVLVLNLFQIVAVGILLSATLSVLSHEIESYGKSTLAEKINKALFKAQYVFGSFLFFLAYSWSV